MTRQLYTIRKEYQHEDSAYYHIHELAIEEKSEEDPSMVKVYDIHDGLSFWVDIKKLKMVR